MYPILALAVYCGLREGEVLGVFYVDIDWEAKTIHVNHAVQYLIGKGLTITEPKTDKAKRTVSVPDFVIQAIKEHCEEQNINQLPRNPKRRTRHPTHTRNTGNRRRCK